MFDFLKTKPVKKEEAANQAAMTRMVLAECFAYTANKINAGITHEKIGDQQVSLKDSLVSTTGQILSMFYANRDDALNPSLYPIVSVLAQMKVTDTLDADKIATAAKPMLERW